MKGYIVGYIDEWANNRNAIITGYYTTWNKGISALKILEKDNIKNWQGLRQVYIVEIEVNKTYAVAYPTFEWINNYKHYITKTINRKTTLHGSNGKNITINIFDSDWKTIVKGK